MLFGFRSSHLKDLNISVEVIVRTQELYEIVLQASTFVIAELTEAVKSSSKCDGRAGDNSTLWVPEISVLWSFPWQQNLSL